MTYKMPFRRTILHFEQRFLIEADTFIVRSPSGFDRERSGFQNAKV